ncbi:amino acid transporter [Cohnella pontilimi]|uniref:Amino acid transporter n=1 Tax=Cohnella pontilimi TaxID=2564100 RepID=A0A4U0FFW4_9BACL|nr:LysE family transporter [Cohnella pontilimi]TJY43876.1 amino acid transporter [Cohnella pontilimi]
MLPALLHGFILAIGLIIPLGVQNFFIFSQGATRNRFSSVVPIVISASLCDTLLILLAVSGVSLVVMNFVWMKTVLLVLGILFLLYMGFLSWRDKPVTSTNQPERPTQVGKLVLYTAMISILNPHAILDTIGVIGTSSMAYEGEEMVAFTAACIFVSWLWFFLLAALGRLIGSKDPTGKLVLVLNKISAIVMWTAAIYLFRQLQF